MWSARARRPSLKSLQMKAEGDWTLSLRSGQELHGRLLGDSRVTRYLVLLNFKVDRRTLRILIFPDSLRTADAYRKLRIAIRIGSPAEPQKLIP